ncbi:MAG: NRDE family protein [Curvibacter sp.]|nr:MAG: NRDE family protein [Curvibacter sp.]
MCLIAWNWQPGSATPLLLIGNRDEFYARPTEPLHFWPDTAILAGRDAQAGGTWLGVGQGKRLAGITNYRSTEPPRLNAPSRGQLVTDFLQSSLDAEGYLQTLRTKASAYNAFNLLVFDGHTLMGLESRSGRILPMQPGAGAVSNADFHTPWPKLRQLKEGLTNLVTRGEADDAYLWPLLQSRAPAPDAELPATGVPLELERALSAVFVATPGYGTRACSVVRVKANEIRFSEQRFGASGPMGHNSLLVTAKKEKTKRST